ncbi:MAG: hypothetical protein LBM04_05100, partial [Opitutaceae bacterium]|nr:hypothetical protein [Opitutaceae bacterium]
ILKCSYKMFLLAHNEIKILFRAKPAVKQHVPKLKPVPNARLKHGPQVLILTYLTDITRRPVFGRAVSLRPPRSSPVSLGGLGETALSKNLGCVTSVI